MGLLFSMLGGSGVRRSYYENFAKSLATHIPTHATVSCRVDTFIAFMLAKWPPAQARPQAVACKPPHAKGRWVPLGVVKVARASRDYITFDYDTELGTA